MITREEALDLLAENGVEAHLLQHSLASEAVMQGLAEHFGEDSELWSRTGLLHDLDYPKTESCPERHGLDAAEILAGRLPEEALQAIRAHNGEHNGTPVQSRLDIALRCGFFSPSYFSSQFKRIAGKTPMEYRTAACGGQEEERR